MFLTFLSFSTWFGRFVDDVDVLFDGCACFLFHFFLLDLSSDTPLDLRYSYLLRYSLDMAGKIGHDGTKTLFLLGKLGVRGVSWFCLKWSGGVCICFCPALW
jgi:hypothetical protein